MFEEMIDFVLLALAGLNEWSYQLTRPVALLKFAFGF